MLSVRLQAAGEIDWSRLVRMAAGRHSGDTRTGRASGIQEALRSEPAGRPIPVEATCLDPPQLERSVTEEIRAPSPGLGGGSPPRAYLDLGHLPTSTLYRRSVVALKPQHPHPAEGDVQLESIRDSR